MSWFKRKPKTNWKQRAEELEQQVKSLQTSLDTFAKLDEANLRLIHELRQMDQWAYNLYQCAPDWNRMRPIVADMFGATEKRMEIESNRIKHLMIGEIRSAYNEPPKLRTKLPPANWRLLNQGKPVKTIEGEAKYKGTHEGVPIYEVPKIEDKS